MFKHRLNEPDKGERANCHFIKFAMADAMDPMLLTGDETADELSLLWVVTDRQLPRPGLEWEGATIFYGDEYDRKDGLREGILGTEAPSQGKADC